MQEIDLRSDTVTMPTEEMRKAMAEAEVGDASRGDDPTVNRLEELAADITGKEAAMLVPSGTMGNLVGVMTHCKRGDEIIVGSKSHILNSETAGAAIFANVQTFPVSNNPTGGFEREDVQQAIRIDKINNPRTGLICVENTHNACSGSVLDNFQMKSVCDVAHQRGVPVHLDGARIFNAAISLGIPVAELVQYVDDLTFCVSKGLSAPVGSLVCGRADFIDEARRHRQMLGGAMRQAGIIAAAGIVSINSMVGRLVDDHDNAKRLAMGLAEIPGIIINVGAVQTNIIYFDIDQQVFGSAHEFLSVMGAQRVKMLAMGESRLRMVTHRHITNTCVDQVLTRIQKVADDSKIIPVSANESGMRA